MRIATISTCLLFFFATSVLAHQKHAHPKPVGKPSVDEEGRLRQINVAYRERVKPIFEKKCFDCHGSTTRYPWYYAIPGVKQLINSDIKEAKEHMDMSPDFPFQGHGTPVEDLQAISETVREGGMPPFRYRLMHREAALLDEEKTTIQEWVQKSLEALKPLPEGKPH